MIQIQQKYLPSKRFVSALLIAIALILITLILNYVRPGKINYDNNNLAVANSTSSPSEIDSDHDGLPDWEEALYGTDPHNPDTDGDGTPDGEEIKEGRDPLKANTAPKGQEPNDKIDPKIIAQDQAISNADQNLNATEKMARDLLSNIIASQPVNGQMDQNTVDGLIQQSLQDIPQKQFLGTTTVSDLNLIPATDNQTLLKNLIAYRNNYYIQTEAFQKIIGQDLAIISNSMSNKTDLDKKQLQSIISIYERIAQNLIQMPLPAVPESSGVTYHLKVINDLKELASIDNDIMISSGNGDFASIYADLGVYNDVQNDILSTLNTMDAMFGIKR